jgi:hypothetical protein
MIDDQNQNEEKEKKLREYRNLVMQQDELLAEQNDQETNNNDQSGKNNSSEQKVNPEFTQELKKVVTEEKSETELSHEKAIEAVGQFQEIQQGNPDAEAEINKHRQENLNKKKLAVGQIKLIEGMGKMAADKIESLKTEQKVRQGEKALKETEKKEGEIVANEALNAIQQEAQRKAQEQLQRQIQIKQIQDERKKKEEEEKKNIIIKKKKKEKAKKGFLGLVKKNANPASPGKTLKPLGLNLITAYFESILP